MQRFNIKTAILDRNDELARTIKVYFRARQGSWHTPCQGERREFESLRSLHFNLTTVEWSQIFRRSPISTELFPQAVRGLAGTFAQMKTLSGKARTSGLTLIEALVVVAILAVLVTLLLPALTHGGRALVPRCMSNLRQIHLGGVLYASETDGKFPMAPSAENAPSWNGGVSPHIQKISKHIFGHNLICPADIERHATATLETLTDLNISYFLNVDVSTNNPAISILAGDRNLEAVNQPVKPGLFILSTNIYMRWTDEIHRRRGCFVFEDGHVQLVGTNLNSVIRNQQLATNRLCVP